METVLSQHNQFTVRVIFYPENYHRQLKMHHQYINSVDKYFKYVNSSFLLLYLRNILDKISYILLNA